VEVETHGVGRQLARLDKDFRRKPRTGLIVVTGLSGFVTVDARIGLFRDRVIVSGLEFPVRRVRGGWREVVDPSGSSRVRYDGWRDRLLIDAPSGSLVLKFRWRNTTFPWRGRTYRIDSGFWGRVRIFGGDREAAGGRFTLSGFRLEFVAPELHPIERELAIGLGLRAQAFTWAAV
jgi:hypothetical protein